MRHYIRNRVEGGCYFFTLALADRSERYLVEYVAELRQAFRGVKRRHPFDIEAIVVLPEHLHCMWTLPAGDDDYPGRWYLIKSAFSRLVPKKGKGYPPAEQEKANAASGKDVTGSTRSGTSGIIGVMSITSITTRSSTDG